MALCWVRLVAVVVVVQVFVQGHRHFLLVLGL